MALLEHLPEFVDKLDQRTVVDKIWPHLVRISYAYNLLWCKLFFSQQTGFGDTVAVIREATVRSISLLSSKVRPPHVAARVLSRRLQQISSSALGSYHE